MGIITYNGISSEEFGIHVETPPNYEMPERNYETISIPGRNGDLMIDLGSYKNVDREYNISFGEECGDFTVLASQIPRWLYSGYGYQRLEDSYEPEYYKMAVVKDAMSVANILRQAGRATITFNRKPQRFLKIGDNDIIITKATRIHNPTQFDSLPLITITGTGNGEVNIGGYTVKITGLSSDITIDCELQESYTGTLNVNNKVALSSYYPKLIPGDNDISFSGGITKIIIKPRWWTI